MPINKVRFEVLGSPYVISTQDETSYVLGLAQQLEDDIKIVLEHSPGASSLAATIICAMGYLDEAKKSKESLDNMRVQIKEYLQESAKAKEAANETQRELERLRREVNYLAAHKPPNLR